VNTHRMGLEEFSDERGTLTVCELPFDAKRVFWIRDVDKGERGDHSMKTCEMIVVAIEGSFDAIVEDQAYRLVEGEALYLAPADHRVLTNFSWDAVCLVLAGLPAHS
jgi:glyoxylate utilization-related uncharacterized protein